MENDSPTGSAVTNPSSALLDFELDYSWFNDKTSTGPSSATDFVIASGNDDDLDGFDPLMFFSQVGGL